jgi:hypothetical protein
LLVYILSDVYILYISWLHNWMNLYWDTNILLFSVTYAVYTSSKFIKFMVEVQAV